MGLAASRYAAAASSSQRPAKGIRVQETGGGPKCRPHGSNHLASELWHHQNAAVLATPEVKGQKLRLHLGEVTVVPQVKHTQEPGDSGETWESLHAIRLALGAGPGPGWAGLVGDRDVSNQSSNNNGGGENRTGDGPGNVICFP